MTEDKKPEANGPPSNMNVNHRNENPRGGRHRFSRFGPHRDQERPVPCDQVFLPAFEFLS